MAGGGAKVKQDARVGRLIPLAIIIFLILVVYWIGMNRIYLVGRINWADDFIWGSRWDRVLAGQLPYRDFFELYGPGFPILFAPLYAFLGKGLVAIRFIHFLLFPLVALGTMVFAFLCLGLNRWRLTAAVLLLTLSFLGMTWLDQPIRTWFGLLALLPAVMAIRSGQKWAIFAGLSAVLSGLLSTEQGVAVAVADSVTLGFYPLATLFRRKSKNRTEFKLLGYFLATLGLGWSIVFLWMAGQGMLTAYLQTAFEQIPMYQNAAYGLIFPGYNLMEDPLRLGWYLPFVFWIFFMIYWLIKRKNKGSSPLAILLLVYSIFSLRIYIGRTEIRHFVVDTIPIFILGVATWFDFWKEKNNKIAEILLTTIFFGGFIILSGGVIVNLSPYWQTLLARGVYPFNFNKKIVYLTDSSPVRVFPEESRDIKGVLEFIDNNVHPGEEIYPFAVISGFSSLLSRTTPNYFEQAWFAQTYKLQKKLIMELERRKIAWVIYSLRDDVIRLDQLSNFYILNTFKPVVTFGDYTIMKRFVNWSEGAMEDFGSQGELVGLGGLSGVRDVGKREKNVWEIKGDNPTWVIPMEREGNLLVFRYRLRFGAGLATLSKTALRINWGGRSEVYDAYLLPGDWQEAWVEIPRGEKGDKLVFSLSWSGGLNPRATLFEIDQIRVGTIYASQD